MPSDQVAAEPVAETKRALNIDTLTGAKFTEVGLRQGLRPGPKVGNFALAHGCQAATVEGDAFTESQFAGERQFNGQMKPAGSIGRNSVNRRQRFNEAGEHSGILPYWQAAGLLQLTLARDCGGDVTPAAQRADPLEPPGDGFIEVGMAVGGADPDRLRQKANGIRPERQHQGEFAQQHGRDE